MCGIVGVVATRGRVPSVDRHALTRMRDRLAHRGPDDAGLWRQGQFALGHRRLAVLDPTRAGHQPMLAQGERFALVYNGELYNDRELRGELESLGVRFTSACDAETLLHALIRWGEDAIDRLRGMYAFAFCDAARHRLILGRDPLGIKPLYWWMGSVGGGHEMALASEIPALLEHPSIRPRANPRVISSYLTTIRTTLGRETLYDGIATLRAGEWLDVDLSEPTPRMIAHDAWDRARASSDPAPDSEPEPRVRSLVDDSVLRHLRADVPVCALLSGGLDSTIITSSALSQGAPLATYASGAAAAEAEPSGSDEGTDLAWAARVAETLGLPHAQVPISRDAFALAWPEMIARLGVPLSTPNEVAIHALSRRLRRDGHVVALSGEGADELFAGYDGPMRQALEFVESGGVDGGLFTLDAHAWVARRSKPGVLSPWCWQAAGEDETLVSAYRSEFNALRSRADTDDPIAAHLAMQRRINLAGLLQRLDTATMLAGVEGRTPLADFDIARLAESLPVACKYRVAEPIEVGGLRLVGERHPRAETKAVLRAAFADRVPRDVRDRAKASFPLPFQEWVADHAAALSRSEFACAIFTPQARSEVARRPHELWPLAWPMVNLALWGERVWG